MSHDQKPSRVRVVTGADTPSQRRRGDGGTAATAIVDQGAGIDHGAGDDADAELPPALPLFVAGAAFLITAAATGAAIAWFMPT